MIKLILSVNEGNSWWIWKNNYEEVGRMDVDDAHLNKLERDKNNNTDNQSHYLSLVMNKLKLSLMRMITYNSEDGEILKLKDVSKLGVELKHDRLAAISNYSSNKERTNPKWRLDQETRRQIKLPTWRNGDSNIDSDDDEFSDNV